MNSLFKRLLLLVSILSIVGLTSYTHAISAGFCGDGFVEPGIEQCDGPVSVTCADYGFNSGTVTCSNTCIIDRDDCTNIEVPICGDGVVDTGEECDDTVTTTCADLGFDSGTVRCSNSCTIDGSGCFNTLVPQDESCDDGIDNDNDTDTDCDDSDCSTDPICLIQGAVCGNGVVEGDEICDGSASSTCADFGYDSGTVTCNGCVEDSSGCFNQPVIVPTVCGDGVVEGDEICDEGSNNGVVCTPEYGDSCDYCNTACEYEPVMGGSCGDGIVQEAYEQCEGENTMYTIVQAKDAYSEDSNMCSSIGYGEACTLCNPTTCQNQIIEGPKCGDGHRDTAVCVALFDLKNSESETSIATVGERIGESSWVSLTDGNCNADKGPIAGLEGCAIFDGSAYFPCDGSCSQGACQPAITIDIPDDMYLGRNVVNTLRDPVAQLEDVCFFYKTGLLEHGDTGLRGYTYHGNGMGSIADSEEILNLDEACANTTIPQEECDAGDQNGVVCSGDGCTYCTSSCEEKEVVEFNGGSSSSASSSTKFITNLSTDTQDTTKESEDTETSDQTTTEEENTETQEKEEEQQETPEQENTDTKPTESQNKEISEDNSECYEENYITDRFSKLSALPIEEVITVPDEFQKYFNPRFTIALNTLLNTISGMEDSNALIEKVVCKIETTKAANGTKYQNTGYESGGSVKEYILQYIQDRVILLYTVQE